MLTIREYKKAATLEEAYELNQKKNNRIVAGGLWLRLGHRSIVTAIDLSELGLDQITENDEEFVIGCMTTLRAIELHAGLNQYTKNAIKESVRHIVGVQFRNCATVGGSIYGRFGFSDLLTVFLAMDAEVELYKAGRIPLAEFVHMPYDNDILVALHIKKVPLAICYQSCRNTATDFPVVACAVSCYHDTVHVSIGARPARAEVISVDANRLRAGQFKTVIEDIIGSLNFGTNRRAGAEYRRHVAKVLVLRAGDTLLEQQSS